MKFRKISLILAVLLLLQSLVACNLFKKEEPDVTLATADLSGYTVIYPTKASQTLKDAVGDLTAKVKEPVLPLPMALPFATRKPSGILMRLAEPDS